MKDSKVKVTPEDIALAKALKELRKSVQRDDEPFASFEDFLKHVAKVKEVLESDQPSRKEREAQRDEAYEKMLEAAAEGKEAGSMVGWLSVPILENEDDTLTTKIGVVLTSSHARDALLSALLKLLEQLEEADD